MEVDLVYCWCNGADPDFIAQRDEWARREGAETPRCRFAENGELRRSLESVRLYAPWFRRIWVVVNDVSAIPDWLAADSRVTIVRHGEIMPQIALPNFNAVSIEFWLWRIPGLAERFVYANDDMFLGRSVAPRFFFDGDGRVICRYLRPVERPSGQYALWLANNREFFAKVSNKMRLDSEWRKTIDMTPHHNMDGRLKSVMEDFCKTFPEVLDIAKVRFRNDSQLQCEVFSLWAMATGRGVCRDAKRGRWRRLLGLPRWESLVYDLDVPWALGVIERERPYFFCLNDAEGVADEQRGKAAAWLERQFGGRRECTT